MRFKRQIMKRIGKQIYLVNAPQGGHDNEGSSATALLITVSVYFSESVEGHEGRKNIYRN